MMKLKGLPILVCLLLAIAVVDSCKKDVSLPTLTTTTPSPSGITISSVTTGGSITNSGGADITDRGVCYGTSSNPTISGLYKSSGTGSGTFSTTIDGLTPDTKYYLRAYATNSAGTAYGNEVSFTTTALKVPTVTTVETVSSITYNSAVSGGSITDDGGATVTANGVCWSTSPGPVATGDHAAGVGTTSFTSNLTALTPGTLYYVRAYATNSVGTAYGDEVTFTTTALGVPVLTTTEASNISFTTATSGGEVTSSGGADVTVRGVCWSTSQNPEATGNHTTNDSGLGIFTSNLTNLLPGTLYHIRAYATNSVGTGYGTDRTFTTLAVGLATVTTLDASAVSYTTASSGGEVTSEGGGTVSAKGVCWGTASGPVATGAHTTNGSGIGSFTSNITGLTQNTTYYLRAYAINDAGTAYGTEITFKTTAVALATVATSGVSLITTTSAQSGGTISSAGGGNISAKGVCWSLSSDPTTADPKTSQGPGTTTFVSDMTPLLPGTLYHVRAYAINEAGTAYGDDVPFTTTAISAPTVTTTAITAVAATTATSGGNVTDDGNGTITARGVCWGTTSGPIATGSHTSNGTGTGPFTSNITGLAPSTTYFVRAYATNSATTSYGEEFTLTTYAATDIDGNNYTSVVIGTQTWLVQNLKTTKYANGDLIGTSTTPTQDLTSVTDPKYQWAYGGDENNVADYGRLYTWFAATDSRSVCPTGWRLPSDAEWTTLSNFLGADAGGKLKETGTTHWQTDSGATNETGFTALGSGYRDFTGPFASIKVSAYLWSANSGVTNDLGWGQNLSYSTNVLTRGGYFKKDGAAVRCLK
jgi:uncharacterized protein (TIGR02145 family)